MTNVTQWSGLALPALAAALLMPASPSFAANLTWTNSGTGSFMEASNWDTNTVPALNDEIFIGPGAGAGGTATLTQAGPAHLEFLRVGQSGAGSLLVSGGGTLDSIFRLHIGALDGGNGFMSILGESSSVTATSGFTLLGMGDGAVASGTMTVGDGGTFTHSSGGLFILGDGWFAGTYEGTLNINDGGTVTNTGGATILGQGNAGTGTGTINVNNGGTFSNNGTLVVGNHANGVGQLNLETGGSVTTGTTGGWFMLGDLGGTGVVDMTGGQLNANDVMIVAINNSTGTLNMSGGEIAAAGRFIIGDFLSTGVMNMSDGVLVASSGIATAIGIGEAGDGTLNLSGGTFTSAAVLEVGTWAPAELAGATGVINMSGGVLNANGNLALGVIHTGSSGTLNLDGGVLNTGEIHGGIGTSTVNFNGGTVVATGNNAAFISGVTNANIGDGGLWIDSEGFNIGIGQDFNAAGGTNGAVTLLGSGEITLSGTSVQRGQMVAAAGSVVLDGALSFAFDQSEVAFGESSHAGAITGELFFGGDLSFLFDSTAQHGTYEVFLFDSQSGDFDSVTIGGIYSANLTNEAGVWTGSANGLDFTFSQITGGLTVIPEPSAYALIGGFGVLAFILVRRRRR